MVHMKGIIQSTPEFENLTGYGSVVITRIVANWYVTILAVLTIFTQVSLLISISFRVYAYLTLAIFIIMVIGLARKTVDWLKEINLRDIFPLLIVLLAGGLAGWIVMYFQPVRQLGAENLDDYYYLANPLYYLQNPSYALSFQVRDYYSGQVPFTSAALYIAGAYQYIQAAFAYLLRVNFIEFSYLFVSAVSGFMFPLAVYLVLTKLSTNTLSAAIGAAGTLLIVLLLGESERSPGTWIFSRVFQGKSIVVSTGIYLLIYYSLNYFANQNSGRWVNLTSTVVTLTGMSTSSIMLLPSMSAIAFTSFYLVAKRGEYTLAHFVGTAFKYFSALIYLMFFAVYVLIIDSGKTVVYANQGYPLTLLGYVGLFFREAKFPVTLLVLVIFSITAIVLTRGTIRKLVAALIFLPFLILNPLVSDFLIKFFYGVYFRMFYILPLFLVIGVTISRLFDFSKVLGKQVHVPVWVSALLAVTLLFLYAPTSIRSRLRSFEYHFSGKQSQLAKEVIKQTPKGLMLAPFPLSSVVFTFDPAYPQMYVRPDISDLFLWKQGRIQEVTLRSDADDFLLGYQLSARKYQAFVVLVELYPEIRSIVISQKTLRSNSGIEVFLQDKNFLYTAQIQGFAVFWK